MSGQYEELLEEAVEISADPRRVWTLVSDVRRMAEWSPQVESVRLDAGPEPAILGAEFTNLNREGALTWTTHGKVARVEPDREFAFRIEENWVVWSFCITPLSDDPLSDHGVRLTQRRETPDGISDYSLQLTEKYLGGQESFTALLRAGMQETLARIKAAAES